MTFHQLTYVVEISKCGSINKAAHKLHLSQSGISSAVRELEEELGIQFFRRSNRGVEFTPEGKGIPQLRSVPAGTEAADRRAVWAESECGCARAVFRLHPALSLYGRRPADAAGHTGEPLSLFPQGDGDGCRH